MKPLTTVTLLSRAFLCLALLLIVGGCASTGGSSESLSEFQEEFSTQSRVEDINEQLLALSVSAASEDNAYRIGPGDQIKVDIFNVAELSREYRVDGAGKINMPLVGELSVSGYDLATAERIIADAYAENYLRNPQVAVTVTEFRSKQFTAIGALASPRVYNIERRTTLLEAIAMTGGLASGAGKYIYLTDRVRNDESGELGTRSLIINVEELLRTPGTHNVVLGDGALINVPQAGSVFVEGAVERPGVYNREGDTTVLKAITMAGGLKFEASRSQLRVLKRDEATDEWVHSVVSFSDIRDSPDSDIALNDGDIVMVEYGPIRTAWTGGLRLLRDVAFLGFRPF